MEEIEIIPEPSVLKKFKRTNVFLIDEELWAWAQYQAKILEKESVSEYLFDLIKNDKERLQAKKKTG